MKKIILILFIIVTLQSAIAQQKKKVIAKSKTTTAVKKVPAPKEEIVKKATTTTNTTEKVTTKEVPPQKENTKKTATSEKVNNNQTSSKKVSSKNSNNAEAYSKDDFQLNAGIGTSGWGVPVYFGGDYFVDNDISIGAEISYQTLNENFIGQNYNSSIIGIGINGNYHFRRVLKIPNEWDLYAGVGISYYIWSYDNPYYSGTNSSGTAFGGQIGARYFFNKKFAINAELGGASTTSGARIGITYKF